MTNRTELLTIAFFALLFFQPVTAEEFPTATVKRVPITGIGPEKGVCRRDPSDVIKVGDLYYVWYSKGPIKSGYNATVWYATSTDGITWTEKEQAIGKGEEGSWDFGSVFTPGILVAQDRYWLFFTGSSQPFQQGKPDSKIGLAVADSPDGPWKKFENNPILRNSDNKENFDSLLIDDSCAMIRNDKIFLYYKGRQFGKSPHETQMGLAIANSPTGPYVKHESNPVIKGNHAILNWPQGKGVAAMIGATGPEELTNSVQLSEDGINFTKTHNVVDGPRAAGFYSPDAFTGNNDAQPISWGIEIGKHQNGQLPYLERVEIQWPEKTVSAASVKSTSGKKNRPPNILLIYVDDMGFSDLGCYGAKTPTPNIDRFADQGVRFTNYLAAANVCSPSRAAVLTGRYPPRCGMPVCSNDRIEEASAWHHHIGLPQSEITIAELLKPLGYTTAAHGKWHLGNHKRFAPRKQGFDQYIGRKHNFHVGKPGEWLHNEEPQDEILFAQAHQRLTDATVDFMKKQHAGDKPFFIYLAHYLVHGPWSPNKEFCTPEEWASVQKKKGKINPKALPAMVRELDHHVGLVLKSLEDLGIEKETMVVFASDNGPWLPAGSAKPFAAGKYTTMEGGHRVPAIIRWPDRFPGGQVSDQLVSALDLFPTIAAACDVSLPSDRKYDGFDLTELLSGQIQQSPRDEFAYYNGLTLEAVRQGPWKLHLPRPKTASVYWAARKRPGAYFGLDDFVLNHLDNDPREQQNLTNTNPDQSAKLQQTATTFRDELGDWDTEGTNRFVSPYAGDLHEGWRGAAKVNASNTEKH